VEVDRSVVGASTGVSRVVVERGPVARFADAVRADDPVYRDASAALAAGFPAVPAPFTFPVALEHWGRLPEMQEGPPVADNPVARVLAPLLAHGGVVLHGEEEIFYYRPIYVGDVLRGEGVVADVYERESGGRRMTFVVVETRWSDERTGEPVVTVRMNVLHRS
jgi:hypothetical protein